MIHEYLRIDSSWNTPGIPDWAPEPDGSSNPGTTLGISMEQKILLVLEEIYLKWLRLDFLQKFKIYRVLVKLLIATTSLVFGNFKLASGFCAAFLQAETSREGRT